MPIANYCRAARAFSPQCREQFGGVDLEMAAWIRCDVRDQLRAVDPGRTAEQQTAGFVRRATGSGALD